jgi:TRAP-type transport system small permease protein
VFVGVSAAVRASRHIHVDFLFRLIPAQAGRALSTLVDAVRIAFFGYATVLTWQMMEKMANYRMTIIDLPMNLVYGVCMFGFACCTLRSIQVAVRNWRRGYSTLERPDVVDA